MKPHTPVIGLLGGSFDPVHLGHIEMAQHCLQNYPLDEIQYIPNRILPHHKTAHVNSLHRQRMLAIAIANISDVTINPIELEKKQPSYTIDTVKALHAANPTASLCFILGCDVFDQLERWHESQQLINFCHFIVIGRSHTVLSLSPWQQQLLAAHQTDNPNDLITSTAGHIILDPFTPQSICSSIIRQQLHNGDTSISGLNPSVLQYIKQHDLYR